MNQSLPREHKKFLKCLKTFVKNSGPFRHHLLMWIDLTRGSKSIKTVQLQINLAALRIESVWQIGNPPGYVHYIVEEIMMKIRQC
jgi:hypothetical protein